MANIRINDLAEFPELISVCAQWSFDAWGKYTPGATVQKSREKFREHCNKDSLPTTILPMLGEKVAGMASLRTSDGLKEDLTPWLGGLYVEKKMRRQGIGKRLIKQIEGKAIELGFGELHLLTYDQSLSAWYSSLGWRRIGMDSVHGHPVTVMKISLT